jgi:hypothetical protein
MDSMSIMDYIQPTDILLVHLLFHLIIQFISAYNSIKDSSYNSIYIVSLIFFSR